MPVIKPITDLRNTNEISELCHKQQQPVFITKNGYGDLVVMSMETYDELLCTNHIDKAQDFLILSLLYIMPEKRLDF